VEDRVADERVTLRQAAARLGVSESAIRKRVERGTLRSDKGTDGRRYVYLDIVADTVTDEGADTSATHEPEVLISQLRDEVAYLREESRRKDEIIMQQAITMRQLSAPVEEARVASAEDAPQSPPSPGPTQPPTDAGEGPQTATEGRSWWRKVFGG
jgi:hypothetical protein